MDFLFLLGSGIFETMGGIFCCCAVMKMMAVVIVKDDNEQCELKLTIFSSRSS